MIEGGARGNCNCVDRARALGGVNPEPLATGVGRFRAGVVDADVAYELGHSGSSGLLLLAQNRPCRTHSATSSLTENRCRGFASNLAPSA